MSSLALSTERLPTDRECLAAMTDHAHNLIAENAQLERELRAAQHRIERLERSLTLAMTRYAGHRSDVVDGVLTVVLNAGDVYQRVQRHVTRAGEAGYEYAWQKLPPVPGSPAAQIEAALAAEVGDEMACIADDDATGYYGRLEAVR